MTIHRSATFLTDEEVSDDVQAEVNELARRWSYLHSEIENEGFARQARFEDGADDYCPDEDDEPGVAAGAAMRRQLKDTARRTELETIEEMLAERGLTVRKAPAKKADEPAPETTEAA